MKELLSRLFTLEKERTRRWEELRDYFKWVITNIPPQVLENVGEFQASKYIRGHQGTISFGFQCLESLEREKDRIYIKKSGLARLKDDLTDRLEMLTLKMEYYLDEE